MTTLPTRRGFIGTSAGLALAAPSLAADALPKGKAEHCVMIWLGGGSCQIDTWDPKRKGDAKARKPGSYYDPIDTAIPGVQVCEHLKKCAPIMDRLNPARSVHHEVIDEHFVVIVLVVGSVVGDVAVGIPVITQRRW